MTKIVRDEFENDTLLSDINRIINMTNKEAANFLEKVIIQFNGGRRNGKTAFNIAYETAMKKAVTALRKDVLYVCDRTRCENCSNQDDCFMTSDINHAANFVDAGDGIYVEQTPINPAGNVVNRPDIFEELGIGESEDSEYNDRMCEKCKEKETCEDYRNGIEHGLIPFGCSKPIESEAENEDNNRNQ